MPFHKFIPVILLSGFLGPPLLWQTPAPSAGVCDVRAFGAKGDGTTLDTAAITQAIQACAQAGGGTVHFTAGTYVTGTFELSSNITLDLDAGAVVRGSSNISDYGKIGAYGLARNYGVDSSGEGVQVGIIVARNAHDIAIVGRGAIDGQGDSFMDLNTPHVGSDFDARYTRDPEAFTAGVSDLKYGPVLPKEHGAGRPGTMLIFLNCKNVLVRDVTLRSAPNWTLHLQNTEQVVITGVHIDNDLRIPNNDGIDCMHCRHVHISDSDVQAGDDDLAIFGSDDVNVTNCSLISRSAAIRLESTRHSTFDNLSIDSNRGIGIFHGPNSGDSTESVLFSNITMRTRLILGHWWGKAEPIYIAVSPCAADQCKGGVRDITFSNISAEAESGILIYGAENSPISGLTLDRIRLKIIAPEQAIARSMGGNFDLRWTARNLQEAIFKHDIPAVYCRYVQNFHVHGLELLWGDNLPDYFSDGIHCEQFRDINIDQFEGRQAPTKFTPSKTAAALSFSDGIGLSVTGSSAAAGTATFLKLSNVTGRRAFVNYDLTSAKRAVVPANATFRTSNLRRGKVSDGETSSRKTPPPRSGKKP